MSDVAPLLSLISASATACTAWPGSARRLMWSLPIWTPRWSPSRPWRPHPRWGDIFPETQFMLTHETWDQIWSGPERAGDDYLEVFERFVESHAVGDVVDGYAAGDGLNAAASQMTVEIDPTAATMFKFEEINIPWCRVRVHPVAAIGSTAALLTSPRRRTRRHLATQRSIGPPAARDAHVPLVPQLRRVRPQRRRPPHRTPDNRGTRPTQHSERRRPDRSRPVGRPLTLNHAQSHHVGHVEHVTPPNRSRTCQCSRQPSIRGAPVGATQPRRCRQWSSRSRRRVLANLVEVAGALETAQQWGHPTGCAPRGCGPGSPSPAR